MPNLIHGDPCAGAPGDWRAAPRRSIRELEGWGVVRPPTRLREKSSALPCRAIASLICAPPEKQNPASPCIRVRGFIEQCSEARGWECDQPIILASQTMAHPEWGQSLLTGGNREPLYCSQHPDPVALVVCISYFLIGVLSAWASGQGIHSQVIVSVKRNRTGTTSTSSTSILPL